MDPVRRARRPSATPHVLYSPEIATHREIPWRDRAKLQAYLSFRAIIESDVMTRAAALSYTLVFSLVPLVTTTLAFFTAFPGLRSERRRVTDLLFEQLLPGAVQSVQAYLEHFSERAAAAGAVSSLVFVVLILLLFQAVEDNFNRIWKAERGRTWGERLQALAVFFSAGAIAAALLVVIRQKTQSFAERVADVEFLGVGQILTRFGLEFVSMFVAWTAITVALKILPHVRVRWIPALTGGIVVGTIWHFLKSGFTWYVGNVAGYENIYGTLGTVPVFFLWVYLTLLLLLAGGYISFVTQNLRAVALTRRERKGRHALAFYAVLVASTLARAFRDEDEPLSAEQIAERLGTATYFVSEALIELCRADMVLAVESGTDSAYVLARPPEAVSVKRIVKQVAGEELVLPQAIVDSPLHAQLRELFETARRAEDKPLEEVTLSELLRLAPGAPASTGKPERAA